VTTRYEATLAVMLYSWIASICVAGVMLSIVFSNFSTTNNPEIYRPLAQWLHARGADGFVVILLVISLPVVICGPLVMGVMILWNQVRKRRGG
jgi:Na+/H+-dicarboxylate symporter